MFPGVNTQDWKAVEREVEGIFQRLFANENFAPVHETFADIEQLFAGHYPGYQSCDMRYHDSEHTLQATVAMVRLLDGMEQAPDGMPLTPHGFTLGMHAVLMHDAGYLKLRGDIEGTGAKYTMTHVNRSAEFANRYLRSRGYPVRDRAAVEHMIHSTGFFVDTGKIPFHSELERMLAYALQHIDQIVIGQLGRINRSDDRFGAALDAVLRFGGNSEQDKNGQNKQQGRLEAFHGVTEFGLAMSLTSMT